MPRFWGDAANIDLMNYKEMSKDRPAPAFYPDAEAGIADTTNGCRVVPLQPSGAAVAIAPSVVVPQGVAR